MKRRTFLKASAAVVGSGWVADLTAAGDEDIDYIGGKILNYKPLPAPAAFHRSQAKFRWIMGGSRSGKSESNIGYDLCSFAIGMHPFRKTPKNAVIWAVADSWPLVGKLLWGEKVKDYLPAEQIKRIIWHNAQMEIPQEIQLYSGVTIEFKAGEQRRKEFQGRQVHAIYQDEQLSSDSEGIFTEMQARLLDYKGFFTGSMTPIQPQPWLEERVMDLPPTDEVFYANLNDNRRSRGGYIDDAEIDMMINDWPIEIQKTRIEGYFAAFFGAVYKTFNRSIHVCKPFKIPSDWQRYRAIDWGFNNPFVCLWAARDHDGRWYFYNEHYAAQQTLAYHASEIHRISGREKYRVTWADWEAQERHEFRQLGINTMPAKKDVHLGIEAVQAALKVQGDGRPRIQIFDTLPHTIKETGGYKWAEGNENRDAKDEPLKLNDHTQDCKRYIIYGVDHKGYFSRLVA